MSLDIPRIKQFSPIFIILLAVLGLTVFLPNPSAVVIKAANSMHDMNVNNNMRNMAIIKLEGLATMAWMVASSEGATVLSEKDAEEWVFNDAGYVRTEAPGVYKGSQLSMWVRMQGLMMEHSTGSDFTSPDNKYYCSWVDPSIKNDGEIIETGRCK